ncbi:hypothetical protein MSIMFB_02340 [Mycobacterium simulans]|uniref:Uncharacterized protein n=1 Tax=Mycobacterium simulans TaxID=627089 RepID=A0A7Z7IJT8_9MYCO|nr:hypothetical protein MSIMFB_02340 [Mycobacterium simulans]
MAHTSLAFQRVVQVEEIHVADVTGDVTQCVGDRRALANHPSIHGSCGGDCRRYPEAATQACAIMRMYRG